MSNPHQGSSLEDLHRELGELDEVKELADKKIKKLTVKKLQEILNLGDEEEVEQHIDALLYGIGMERLLKYIISILEKRSKGEPYMVTLIDDFKRTSCHYVARYDRLILKAPFERCPVCETKYTAPVSECCECGVKVGEEV